MTQALTEAQLRQKAIDIIITSNESSLSDTGTITSVSSSATNVTLKAANSLRKGLTIYNESTQIMYLKLGTTASATSYTSQLEAGDYYETPYGYTGIVDALWASANGSARITELT